MGDDINELRKLFAQGLVNAGENFEYTNKNTAENSGEKFELRSDFSREFDNWDKKNDKKIFSIGVTSKALQSIGVSKKKITWDGKKILKIMAEHSEMTADIIKQVPKIIEEPIIVMQSKNINSRITMFGEVYSNGKPLLAVLELSPKNKHGYDLGEIKIASAYAKDKAQNLINSSNILYIESNKKRINTFSTLTGLQLPVGGVNPINIIPTSTEKVNSKNKESARDSDLTEKYPNLNLNQDISALDGVPAIRLVDGSILPLDEFNGRRMLHVEFIQKRKIDFEDIESGGWIGNGEYEPSFTSDTQRFVERMSAKKKVADLTGEKFDQFKYSDRDPEAAEQLKKVNRQLDKDNARLSEDLKSAKEMIRLQSKVTKGKMLHPESLKNEARCLIKSLNANGNAAEFAKILNDAYGYILNGFILIFCVYHVLTVVDSSSDEIPLEIFSSTVRMPHELPSCEANALPL